MMTLFVACCVCVCDEWSKDSVFVHLQGCVIPSPSGSDTVIFQLPDGYRPSVTNAFVVTSSPTFPDDSRFILVQVNSTGHVQVKFLSVLCNCVCVCVCVCCVYLGESQTLELRFDCLVAGCE